MWDQGTQCSLHILINTERQDGTERWVAALLRPGKLSRVLISPLRYKAIICFITLFFITVTKCLTEVT